MPNKRHGIVPNEAGLLSFLKVAVELQKQSLLGEMGVSVRIAGEVSEGKIQDQPAVIIESILSRRSVDFVTSAGAGGQAEMMESDPGSEHDIDLVSEAELRQRRPDLVALIESNSQLWNQGDLTRMKTLEQQVKQANTSLETAEGR